MTIGSVLQAVAPKIGVDVPSSVFGSQEREHVELATVANDMARTIALCHDWQALTRVQAYTGNGETDAWDLPAGFDRMPQKQNVYSSRTTWPLEHVQDADAWLYRQTVYPRGVGYGAYILLGGQMVFSPVLAAGEVARFNYLTRYAVAREDGTLATSFMADGDSFRLDEDLLGLAITWRWKSGKGLPSGQELQDYEETRDRRIQRERGPVAISIRGRSSCDLGEIALPWSVPT